MITVVTWKWHTPGYRSTFKAFTVNALARMVREHYPHPHRFVCVTDHPDGLDPEIEAIPDWKDFAVLRSPSGPRNPSCYRRLRLFHPEIGKVLGARFVSMDLDCVIPGDLTALFHRSEDFLMWGDTNPKTHYNGSFLLMTAGARPQVWTDFNPDVSPRKACEAGHFGSDQGWISYRLGGGETKLTSKDGIYSFNNEIAQNQNHLPPNARIVFFHGRNDPWGDYCQRIPWVRQHYGVVSREAQHA